MRYYWICILSLLLSLTCSPFKSLQAQNYNFDSYSVADGLSLNTILSLCQDDRGYVWFGTNNAGVNYYDGTQFYSLTSRDGLLNDIVYSIIQDKHGNMVFGTFNGLSIYDGEKFTNYDSLPNNLVFSVFEDSKGVLWIGTKNGVAQLIDGEIKHFRESEELLTTGVFTMHEDSKGNLYFGTTNKGVIIYDGENFEMYGPDQGLSYAWVTSVYAADNGDVMIGTFRGADLLRDGKISVMPLEKNHDEHIKLSVSSIIRTKDDEIWFGSHSGIYRADLNGKVFRRYTDKNGLNTKVIWTMMEDREGNMWIATSGKGVMKHKNNADKFSIYNRKDSLPSEDIKAIFQSADGAFWFGSHEGITRMNGEGVQEYTYDQVEKKNVGRVSETYGIDQDSNGDLWFASGKTEFGVVRFDGKSFHSDYNVEQGLPHNRALSIAIDEKDRVWVGTIHGASVIEGADDREIETLDFISGAVHNILNDSKGNHWFGTDNGVFHYTDKTGEYSHYAGEQGFVDELVRQIVEDAGGNYWLATNEGVFRYDGQKFTKISEEDGLSANSVYSIILDQKGNLWAGTSKGIDRINAKAIRNGKALRIKNYGLIDGFTGVENNRGAVCMDQKGRIWFGTVRGAVVYDPALEEDNTLEPVSHITNVRLQFENFDWTDFSEGTEEARNLPINLTMPYGKNHLTFDFVGISLTTPEKVRYKYRLSPLEDKWLNTTRNEAVYSHIPPGSYRFEVMGMNNDGYWNDEPESFSFTILPPWYQTWWFYTLCIVLIGTGVYTFIVVRTKALKRQKELLEEQVRLRTQELREEKEKVEEINKEVLEKNEIIEEKNKDITDSINYAQKIQEALLPAKARIEQTSLKDFFILYYPKDIVSGDFYWFRKTEKMNFIAAVDCTGHGVPGAFMSMIGHNLLNQIVSREELTHPSEILTRLNKNLKGAFAASDDSIQTNDGMDMGMIGFNDEGHIEYSGAQRPAWIVRGGTELEQIKGSSRPIGGIADLDWEYENHVIQVEPGDTIYISSDGFQDQFGGPKGKKFMTKRLKELLVEIQPLDMQAQFKKLDDSLKEWMEGYEQMDDILVIGLKF